MRRKLMVLVTGAVLVTAASVGLIAANQTNSLGKGTGSSISSPASPSHRPTSPTVPTVTAEQLAAAPEARYDTVIPGLLPYTSDSIAADSRTAYQLAADTAIFGADQGTVVAKLPAKNFLGEPTIVVPVTITRDWALILTPARNALPSTANKFAAAQTSGWIRRTAMTHPASLTQYVVISNTAHTLSIVNMDGTVSVSFAVGVGTTATPSPTGVTGYIQARYLDPAQDQSKYPIQLTSLHSAVADNPYGGTDGGLIGIHYQTLNTGAVSHGCIRVPAAAITAINQLPLGTSINIRS